MSNDKREHLRLSISKSYQDLGGLNNSNLENNKVEFKATIHVDSTVDEVAELFIDGMAAMGYPVDHLRRLLNEDPEPLDGPKEDIPGNTHEPQGGGISYKPF